MNIAGTTNAAHVPLDPDKNFSHEAGKLRGHYRQQYNNAARNGLWGTAAGTCGVRTMWRHEDGHTRIIPCLCCQWACSMCGVMRSAWLKREVNEARQREALVYFWTLTIWTETMPAQWSDKAISAFWNHLRRDLVRWFGPMAYVWLREHTKAGYAHLHLLTDMPITQADLSAMWEEVSGGSYIVNVAPVESEKVSDYLAKYCTQEATARATPEGAHLKGKRLFSTSRGVKFAPFRPPGAKVEVLNEGTGEVRMVSVWKITPVPYWNERARLAREHGPPTIERVIGQPGATFATSCP